MCSLGVTPKARRACGVFRLPIPEPEPPAYRITRGGAAAAVLPLRAAGGSPATRLRLGDPATGAMIDLARIRAKMVPEDRDIEGARDEKRRAGVRALLAPRDGQVIGLVTDAGIEG